MIGTLALSALPFWLRRSRDRAEMPTQGNPSELKTALQFALLYAVILVAIAALKGEFGGRVLYGAAAVAGVVEVHAITLSSSQLVKGMRLDASDGWRIIVIALMSNLIFKLATAALLGTRRLSSLLALPYLLAIAVGIGAFMFW
jgi:uncharacterized membrane protein (DUF4010 family)